MLNLFPSPAIIILSWSRFTSAAQEIMQSAMESLARLKSVALATLSLIVALKHFATIKLNILRLGGMRMDDLEI